MNNDSFKDYYKILKVDRNAEQDTITAAYRSLAKKYHPDLNFNNLDEANEKMKGINEAYRILNDVQSRRKYNLTYDAQRKSTINNDCNSYMARKESKEDIKKQNIIMKSFFKFKKRNTIIASIIVILFIYIFAEKILISSDYRSIEKNRNNIDPSIRQTDTVRDGFSNNHLNNSDNYPKKPARKASSNKDRQTNDISQQDER